MKKYLHLLAIIGLCYDQPLAAATLAEAQTKQGISADELLIVNALPKIPTGLNGRYSLETVPSKKVTALYSLVVTAPHLIANHWILFAANPPNLPSQRITNVSSKAKSAIVKEAGPLQRELLVTHFSVKQPQEKNSISWQMEITAELNARHLQVDSKMPRKAVNELSGIEKNLCLRPTVQLDYYRNPFKQWIEKNRATRAEKEGEVDYARRIFQTIAKNFTYEYLGEQDRRASQVGQAGKSDCGGLANLFVATLRSQGIPSRTLAGRWAQSATPGQKVGAIVYFQEHVKAEFFAQGVGWIPVDLSSAILHDKTPAKLSHFAHDKGDFITMHIDDDIVVDTIYFGKKHLSLLQKSTFWATGEGNFNESTMKENWQVTLTKP